MKCFGAYLQTFLNTLGIGTAEVGGRRPENLIKPFECIIVLGQS